MKDQLTKFDNKNITYDDIGNFVNYGNKDFTWINGTELSLYSDANNNKNVIYKYNDKGIRLSKESTEIKSYYHLLDDDIIYEVRNNEYILYV